MTLLFIILATLVVGVISMVGALFIGFKVDLKKLTFYLISLASGTMLGASLLHLIPETLEVQSPKDGLLWVAFGVFLFFILEKFLIWRHCHHHHRLEEHRRPTTASMVLVGDSVHNFIDGVVIASSFIVSVPVGLSITLAIIFHEIPQELGDFGVLVNGGYTVRRALMMNFLSSLTALLGALIAFFFIELVPHVQAYILPAVAGGFLYVSLADLIPQLHEYTAPRQTFRQIALLLAGFSLMFFTLHR